MSVEIMILGISQGITLILLIYFKWYQRKYAFLDKTGAYSRVFGEEYLAKLCKKRKGLVSIVFIDLDNFKGVNDTYGHNEGDRRLKVVATTIESVCRSDSVVSRWGGDEFLIILLDTDEKISLAVAKRIENACQEAGISVSSGTATKRNDESFLKDIVYRADQAMYKNKQAKKAC